MFAALPDLDSLEDAEPFDPREWPAFCEAINRIWYRLAKTTPATKKSVRDLMSERKSHRYHRKGELGPETPKEKPPWLEERIQFYAARVEAGLMIFEDCTISEAQQREGGRMHRREILSDIDLETA